MKSDEPNLSRAMERANKISLQTWALIRARMINNILRRRIKLLKLTIEQEMQALELALAVIRRMPATTNPRLRLYPQ